MSSTKDKKTLCYEAGCKWCCGAFAGKEPKAELTTIFEERTRLYNQIVKKPSDLDKYLQAIEKVQKHKFDPPPGSGAARLAGSSPAGGLGNLADRLAAGTVFR